MEAKASAATFDAQQAPLSSYIFQVGRRRGVLQGGGPAARDTLGASSLVGCWRLILHWLCSPLSARRLPPAATQGTDYKQVKEESLKVR